MMQWLECFCKGQKPATKRRREERAHQRLAVKLIRVDVIFSDLASITKTLRIGVSLFKLLAPSLFDMLP